jgi:putative membrane protein
MTARTLSPAEHARISSAIRAAEDKTSGEIVCVLAHSSDDYFYPAAFMLTMSMLVTSFAGALLLHYWWIAITPWQFVLVQAAALVAALALIVVFPGLRIHLVPRRLRYLRAHRNAVSQFLASDIHLTASRTGVLIFLSLAEHYAEVIADAGIDARVPQERWNEIVAGLVAHAAEARLVEGFEGAIAASGALLAKEFPRSVGDANELDDRLVEI